MNRNILKIQQLLKKNTLESDNILLILLRVRKELEHSGKNDNNLAILKFFCDWALHTKIDRSFAGSTVVSEIHKTVNRFKEQNTNQLFQEIPNILLTQLKNQLHIFLKENCLDVNIVNNSTEWKRFLYNLFEILEDIPVTLQLKHEDALKKKPLTPGVWINKISVVKSNLGGSRADETYCLEMTTSDTKKIIISLTDGL